MIINENMAKSMNDRYFMVACMTQPIKLFKNVSIDHLLVSMVIKKTSFLKENNAVDCSFY